MKFTSFRTFRPTASDLGGLVRFFQVDFAQMVRELDAGLDSLTIGDNFHSFEATVTIPANSEVKITNQFRTRIPTRRLILRSNSPNIVDGDTAWTKDIVTLKNTGGSQATVTVAFLD